MKFKLNIQCNLLEIYVHTFEFFLRSLPRPGSHITRTPPLSIIVMMTLVLVISFRFWSWRLVVAGGASGAAAARRLAFVSSVRMMSIVALMRFLFNTSTSLVAIVAFGWPVRPSGTFLVSAPWSRTRPSPAIRVLSVWRWWRHPMMSVVITWPSSWHDGHFPGDDRRHGRHFLSWKTDTVSENIKKAIYM